MLFWSRLLVDIQIFLDYIFKHITLLECVYMLLIIKIYLSLLNLEYSYVFYQIFEAGLSKALALNAPGSDASECDFSI